MFEQHQQTYSCYLEDCVVLFHSEREQYFRLRGVAFSIWEGLKTPQSVESLVALLLRKYQISEETCRTSTARFINQLREESLISET